jgi:oligopeptide transport system substrate-binding protein
MLIKYVFLVFLFLFSSLTPLTQTGLANIEPQPHTFRMRLSSDPTGFDWHIAVTPVDTYILMNIMEGLVGYDDKLNIIPALAEKWNVSADGKQYTFYLKKDVLWSDGQPLIAQHFVDSWLRLLSPDLGASYAYFLHDIVGAEDFSSGKLKDPAKVGIKALGKDVFQISLKRPVTHFIHMPTFWVTFPMRKDLIEANPKNWMNAGHAVTLGPYLLHHYSPQQSVVLKRNHSYHGKKPALETIELKIVPENATAINLFRNRQLDFVNMVELLELGDLAQSKDFNTAPYLRLHFLTFNQRIAPFDKPQVRRAFCAAVDRTQIPKLFQNTKQLAESAVPPELFLFGGKPEKLEFKGELARQELAKAMILNPSELKVDLLTDNSDSYVVVTQFLQQQFKKHLGVNVEVNLSEFKTFRSRVDLGQGAIHLRRWGADYPDPDTFLSVFLSNSGNNKMGWRNTTYDRLVIDARSLPLGPKRDKLLAAATSILTGEDCPILPLYFDQQLYLLNPKVKGFKINSLNYISLKDLSF